MSDFSDRPLVAGSITGLRSFKVDSLGRLTGVQVRSVWAPGENNAVCRGGEYQHIHRGTVASINCRCGFYAYFDRKRNPHHGPKQVVGIVEGFGITTVGSRGFRSEKARIVALVHRSPLAHCLSLQFGLWFVIAVVNGYYAERGWSSGAWVAAPFSTLFAVIPTVGMVLWVLSTSRVPVRTRDLYPDLPLYRSVRHAVKAHPLTPPPPPTPESDPDFWTRSAA